MGVNLMQGLFDLVFLVIAGIVIVYLRLVRARMRRLVQESRLRPLENIGGDRRQKGPFLPETSAKGNPDGSISSREIEDVLQMKSLLVKLTMERSKLQVVFHDAERMIEDLEQLKSGKVSDPLPTPVRPFVSPQAVVPPVATAPLPKAVPQTEQEKAVSWARSGQSVGQIAEKLGRSEGEVELILGMARLSGGNVS